MLTLVNELHVEAVMVDINIAYHSTVDVNKFMLSANERVKTNANRFQIFLQPRDTGFCLLLCNCLFDLNRQTSP